MTDYYKYPEQDIIEAEKTLLTAEHSWKVVGESLSSYSPAQQLQMIEKWLLAFDPSFGEVLSPLSPIQQHRARTAHNLKFQLHTYHHLFIDANVAYHNSLVASGHENLRSLDRLIRGIEIMEKTVPAFLPEKIIYESRFVDAIQSCLKKNLPKKTSQSLRRDVERLSKHIGDAR